MCRAGILALAIVATAFPSLAATAYVDDNTNSCTPKNGTLACPYTSIQAGIDAAAVGDTVMVLPGVYLEKIFMKNGVDVVSQGGPGVTTLDATGQAFSAVRFSNGVADSTLVSHLSGFTITGGTGRPRTAAERGAPEGSVSGGGIFIYNLNASLVAPVIENNIISGNNLVTPNTSAYPLLLGAGVYVAVGHPQITNNIIQGNTAKRTQGPNTLGDGAGIYATYYGKPIVAYNTIASNLAGDAGGGLALYGGSTEVTANLIQGNTANRVAGAISAGSYSNFIVTSNVIRNNHADQAGGALYVFYGSVSFRNNTLVGNTSQTTGGIWIGRTDATNHQEIGNNIITQNSSADVNFAGGIRALTGSFALGSIAFTYNDLVANTPSDYGGIPDPALSPGNIAAAPVFVDAAGANYRLQPGSPGIDAGSNALAAPIDFDLEPRPLDGDGDNVAVADMGAFELRLDGDSDGDGIPDAQDCAPLVNSVDSLPGQVPNLAVADSAGLMTWSNERQSNVYDVYRSSRAAGAAFAYAFTCVASEVPDLQLTDPTTPAARGTFYYVVAGTNACGKGPLGMDSTGQPIPTPPSPCSPLGADSDSDTVPDRDDNCPLLINPSQADADLDGVGNVCDADADNDGVPDASDCAPLDPTASSAPTGIGESLRFDSNNTTLTWAAEPTAPNYEVFRGEIAAGAPFAYSYDCLLAVSGPPTASDAAAPLGPRGWYYYVVASRNACGESGTGTNSAGTPRPTPAPCP